MVASSCRRPQLEMSIEMTKDITDSQPSAVVTVLDLATVRAQAEGVASRLVAA